MPSADEVKQFLHEKGISVLEFSSDTSTSERAAMAVGCSVGEIAKTMLLFVGNVPVIVVTSGDKKIKSSLLKKATGLKGKVKFSKEEQVRNITGFEPGGVCPFLLPQHIKIIVDESLKRFDIIYPAAGDSHSAAPMTFDKLLKLTKGIEAKVCD